MKKVKRKPVIIIIEVIIAMIFLVGAGITAYPFINEIYHKQRDKSVIEEFNKYIVANPSDSHEEKEDILPELRKALEEYNQKLIKEGQGKISDITEYSSFPVDASKYGLPDNMIGYISIPAIEQELPLYLGADHTNLTKGGAVMGQTSAPIGGVSTNCVIAGHRGWSGTKKFRYLQNVKVGDKIYITNPWEKLTYNVVESKIINPDEFNEVLIRKGKDMITLVTCHPYASNGKYRLLVYAERVE